MALASREESSCIWQTAATSPVDFAWNLDLDAYYSPRRPAVSSSCALPFNRVDVYPDGHIGTCGDGHTIGNVLAGSIADAWNGPERRQLLGLLDRERVLPMCFRCCGIEPGIQFDGTSTPYPTYRHDVVQIRVGLGASVGVS